MQWKSSNITLAEWRVGVVPHSYRSLGESICMYMLMFMLSVYVWKWCVAVICEMKGLYLITVESDETVWIIFFSYLFNVCAFPFYYVMTGFLTPYFVMLFSVWWLYFEYRYPGWRGVVVGSFSRWWWGDALHLVLLFGSWISM